VRYILKDKIPVPCEDLMKWAAWMEAERPRVGAAVTKNGWVSTVFLGIDYNFSGIGKPILFETMIFYGPLDQMQLRCRTWDEAEDIHKEFCDRVKEFKLNRVKRKKIKLQIRGTWRGK
jgi:hypothetical protein